MERQHIVLGAAPGDIDPHGAERNPLPSAPPLRSNTLAVQSAVTASNRGARPVNPPAFAQGCSS